MTARIWDDYITDRDRRVYELGGFAKRGSLGSRLALLVIDVLYHGVGDRPEPILESVKKYPGSCGEAGWQAIAKLQTLLASARSHDVPVVYVVWEPPSEESGYGRYADKMPAITKPMRIGSHGSRDIVEEVAPVSGDRVVRKPKNSGFFGTNLRAVLEELDVDSVLITGATTSGCIRLTAADAFQHDLRAAVVEDCVYDRAEASHAINLWDINAKYADVISLDEALEYIAAAKPEALTADRGSSRTVPQS